MNRKILSALSIIILLLIVTVQTSWRGKKKEREIYELQMYHFKTAAQEKMLDDYFKNALLPALHKIGIGRVGVFKSWANDTSADKLMYVFTPLQSLNELITLPQKLKKDQQYNSASKNFFEADYKNPSYSRMETILLRAFSPTLQMQLPLLKSANKDRVYELRSYESPTGKLFQNKVKMFNEGGEINIFKKLNFNPVFYSEVIAGSKMPNLMYMTSFENKADRDEHWKNFGNDPEWKKLSSMPEYQNNVSHIDISFLYPAEYSDF